MRIGLAVALLALATSAVAGDRVTVMTAALVRTMDPQRPEAGALAWGGDGRIVATGTAAELLQRHPDAKRIDARDAVVVPGLIDAHAHVLGLGLSLLQADLVGTTSKAQVVERLVAFAKTLPDDAWLIGNGWDQNDWPEQDFPTAADLDRAFPDRPVFLDRVDGHAAWTNTAAMRRAGRELSGDWQPEGGRIVRAGGNPTGVFVDAASALVASKIPPPSPEVIETALDRAFAKMLAHGLTGVHDMGTSRELLAHYAKRADEKRLPLRITAYADGDGDALEDLCTKYAGGYVHPGGRLSMRGVKLYADGALGSRGAALLVDYSDDPGNRGILVTEPAKLRAAIAKAERCKVQVATHAIGDRANRLALDEYARHLGANAPAPAGAATDAGAAPTPPRGDRRWRIEHAQVVAPGDIARFAALGVIASMQPTHATSDMPWAQARVGPDRILGAYAWRSFRDAGVALAFGSDFPVESVDPMLGLHAAITREDAAGSPAHGWYAAQRVTAFEALRGFTADAAFAGFAEREVGMLAPGLRADFVVLGADPVDAEPIGIEVRSVYVDGVEARGRSSPEPSR